MKKILGLGNALVDALITIDNNDIISELQLHPNGMTLIDGDTYKKITDRTKHLKKERSTGGSAGNAIACVAALGGNAGFIGRVGQDDNGHFFTQKMRQRGIRLMSISDNTLPTGVATTFVSTNDGQRTFATYLGAAAELKASHLEDIFPEQADYVFIEGYLVQNHELIERAVQLSHARGARVCLDLASWNIVKHEHAFFKQLLPHIDIVFANEDEARAMTGEVGEAAARFLAQTCDIAVVKCGARGAFAIEDGQCTCVAASPVETVLDTTGAGDFFAGGFLYRHAQGGTLSECLAEGTQCAGEVIQVIGTQLPETTWERLRRLSGF